jgi:hypothetical protein
MTDLKGRDSLEGLGVYGSTVMKWILNKEWRCGPHLSG